MANKINFHTTRKACLLHNTTFNASPRLRRYFEIDRPDIQSMTNVELLKCFELSTSIFGSDTYPVVEAKEHALALSTTLDRNILVGILLGPANAIQTERTRMSRFASISLWNVNLAGFAILIVSQRTNRIGGDVICDATRYYTSVHEARGIGAYKEDFVYYL